MSYIGGSNYSGNFDFDSTPRLSFGASRRSSSMGSMKMDMDGCSIMCITAIVITLAILYHVHDLCGIEAKKDPNSTTTARLCNIRMALVILLILEIAALVMKMRK